MHRSRLLLAPAFLVAACATQTSTDGGGESIRLAGDEQFTLTQPLTIPNGWARIPIQDGEVLDNRRDIQQSRAYCELETGTVARPDNPNVVQPDEFASSRLTYFRSISVDRSPRTYSVKVQLSSDKQPDVRRLQCHRTSDPLFSTDVSVQEIREALGSVIEFAPPG